MKQGRKKNYLKDVKKWKRRCIVILVIHIIFLVASTVTDITLDLKGKPLAYTLGIMSLLFMTDMFGAFNLVTRVKTALLIFTICQISFGIIVACLEIVEELRNYVIG